MPAPGLTEARQRWLEGLEHLPEDYRHLDATAAYTVHRSDRLGALLKKVRERVNLAASS